MYGNNPQDDYYSREQARIEARRAANDARRQHFLNAKVRLIGQDVQAIQQQIDEKKRRQEQELEAKRLEEQHQLELLRRMEEIEREEQQRRRAYNQSIQQEWIQTMQQKSYEAGLPAPPDFNHDIAGKSALLSLEGEDPMKTQREQSQKAQMVRWIQEKVQENRMRKRAEEIEEMNYNEMIRMVNDMRRVAEEEEEMLRRKIASDIRAENYQMSHIQRQRNQTLNRVFPEDNKPVALSLDLFNEDKRLAMSADGSHVARRDAFKGFTPEQIARINYENNLVALDNLKRKQREREEEYNWAIQQLQVLEQMERNARHEEYLRRTNEANLREDNRRRYMQDQAQRQRWANERWGAIDNYRGIYDGFGKSCR